jgi:integrase
MVPLRREEWTGAAWSEIAIAGNRGHERWTLRIPAERMKGGRAHLAPLPSSAIAVLRQLQGSEGRTGFIFTNTFGQTSFAGWRRAASRLARAAGLRQPWTIHDIRRGVATQMGELGIRENVIRRILAHSPRGFLGVTATYERSERLDELRDALERWARALDCMLNGGSGFIHREEASAR